MQDQARTLREAEETDGPLLTNLRWRSKAYWGYSAEWAHRVEGDVIIPLRSLHENKLMFVFQEGKQVLGFYSLIRWNPDVIELDDFFLDLPYIGKGLGKELWEDVVARSKTLGHIVLHIIADPNAEGFYRKQGARRVGEIISKRTLPEFCRNCNTDWFSFLLEPASVALFGYQWFAKLCQVDR